MPTRRHILKGGVGSLLISALPAEAIEDALNLVESTKLPIMQGFTDETSTVITVIHNKSQRLNIYAAHEQKTFLPTVVEKRSPDNYQDIVSHVYFDNLNHAQDYQLVVEDIAGNLLDHRTFSSLNLGRTNHKFVVGSCMKASKIKPKIWKSIYKQNTDFIIFVGDAVYADKKQESDISPEDIWRSFCQAKRRLPYSYWPKLKPVFAVWDDHDFGVNNGGKSYPYVKESQSNFDTFFPHPADNSKMIESGPGVSKVLNVGDQKIFLLDGRSFRAEKGSEDIYAHWGKDQEMWLYDHMRNHGGPCWVMTGTQMFPGSSWTESLSYSHTENFNNFIGNLKSLPSKAAFVSGDVHFSEISKIKAKEVGYKTFEITSSSIHSSKVSGLQHLIPNKRRIKATSSYNYNIIHTDSSSGDLQTRVQCVDHKNKLKFKHDFALRF